MQIGHDFPKVDIEIISRGWVRPVNYLTLHRMNQTESIDLGPNSRLDDLSARVFRDRRLPTRISDTPPRGVLETT